MKRQVNFQRMFLIQFYFWNVNVFSVIHNKPIETIFKVERHGVYRKFGTIFGGNSKFLAIHPKTENYTLNKIYITTKPNYIYGDIQFYCQTPHSPPPHSRRRVKLRVTSTMWPPVARFVTAPIFPCHYSSICLDLRFWKYRKGSELLTLIIWCSWCRHVYEGIRCDIEPEITRFESNLYLCQ